MTHNIRLLTVKNAAEARSILTLNGSDFWGVEAMAPKFCHYVLSLDEVSLKGALIIKQEMLSLGGEAALPREAADLAIDTSRVLLSGTRKQLSALINKLKQQPFGLRQVAIELEETLDNFRPTASYWQCGDRKLPLGTRTLIMGILNLTPDSFSDGGKYTEVETAVLRAKEMVDHGADIIDVGGESTRPGSDPVDIDVELRRVLPVVERLVKEIAVPVSVDTTKYVVAQQVIAAGASIINDVSGLQSDLRLADLAVESGAGLVIMHSKGNPKDMQLAPEYKDIMGEVCSFLRCQSTQAMGRGVSPTQIVLDPGIGFGKTLAHNLTLLNRLQELTSLGFPLLLGTSRKSVIGKVLDLPADQRIEGTGATVALGIRSGIDIVRVHDVREAALVAKMADAIVRCSEVKED